jgi:hypothetical protein
MTLSAALADLTDSIKSDGFDEAMIDEIASDWEVNPALLLRKFIEKTGKHPSELVIRDMSETLRKNAIKKASDIFDSRYSGARNHTGKIFTRNGEEFCIVAVCGKAIHNISVTTGRMKNLTFANRSSAADWAQNL